MLRARWKDVSPRQLVLVFLLSLSVLLFFWVSISGGAYRFSHRPLATQGRVSDQPLLLPPSRPAEDSHPIERLTYDAYKSWDDVLAKESTSLTDAAKRYRERRGRHPPPGFGEWFNFSGYQDAVIVEEFFDRIYHDLEPFWGIEPLKLKRYTAKFTHRISIRGGRKEKYSDEERVWMDLWSSMIDGFASDLPDMDIPINVMDESRIMAPWTEVNKLMEKAAESRTVVDPKDVENKYTKFAEFDKADHEQLNTTWEGSGPYWKYVAPSCPPDSPAHDLEAIEDYTDPMKFADEYPLNSLEGYVKNVTFTRDYCNDPMIREMHGSFIAPLSIYTTTEMFPIFSGCKLQTNNDILLPPAMYWTGGARFSGGPNHGAPWDSKEDGLVWRGVDSGGRSNKDNWQRFQRHRLLFMLNGTSMRDYESGSDTLPSALSLPHYDRYNLSSPDPDSDSKGLDLGDWLDAHADTGFITDLCYEHGKGKHKDLCTIHNDFYNQMPQLSMGAQFKKKYLPDVDGNSFSGRYRAFLLSTSLPIKSTQYEEWHDSRLQPWLHYVPMDNSNADLYGILEYYLGRWDKEAHDEQARWIAISGKRWAEKVLRKEDIEIYVYRLLLEWARIVDEKRLKLGFTDDLTL